MELAEELQAHSRVINESHEAGERYLKAVVFHCGLYVPRTHELTELLDLLLSEFPLWSGIRPDLDRADLHYRAFRYDDDATKEEAEQVLATVIALRALVKVALKE